MKKVIVLSAVLGLSAIGMACGDSANTNVTVKPANVTNTTVIAPVNTAPVSTPAPMTPANSTNMSNMKPANTMPPSNMKPTNSTMKTPVPSPTKKP